MRIVSDFELLLHYPCGDICLFKINYQSCLLCIYFDLPLDPYSLLLNSLPIGYLPILVNENVCDYSINDSVTTCHYYREMPLLHFFPVILFTS